LGFVFRTTKTAKTAKKKYVAHLEAVLLDRVIDREEVAHHIVDSAIAIHESAWARIAGVRLSPLPDG
jgi:hypothetical protein